ncbi:MAG TPA: hypothetical protein VEH27_08290 [Methylomirabilota bacterium]|nr:hypothetical protein [Methylomirabilota bacterium]
MVSLPIVERELRVASRSKWLYRARRLTALAATLVGGFLLLTSTGGSQSAGGTLFAIFVGLGFFVALFEGVRKTADCISEEKREGTIGLLFLTDLRPLDVVLGKFAANSIRTFHALLSIFPIIAIALVLGGVTGGEFWRATLVLMNTLFLSLSVSMLASTLNHEAGSSIGLSALILITLAGIIPGLHAAAEHVSSAHWTAWLTFFSPFTTWLHAFDARYTAAPGAFWGSMVVTHAIAWASLIAASLILPRTWSDTKTASEPAQVERNESEATIARRNALRRKTLDQNPAAWLGLRKFSGRYPRLTWFLSIPAAGCMLAAFFLPVEFGYGVMIGLNILLRVLVASQASLNMCEARKNGALELVLSTPLTIKEFVKGQRQAFEKLFFVPVVIALVWHVAFMVKLAQEANGLLGIGWTIYRMGMLILDGYAVGWAGLWMGLKTPKPAVAFFKTMLWGLVAPGVLTLFCIPGLLTDVVLIQIAHDAVIYDFRKLLNEQAGATTIRPVIQAAPNEAPPIVRA